jgi:hypothetical protein
MTTNFDSLDLPAPPPEWGEPLERPEILARLRNWLMGVGASEAAAPVMAELGFEYLRTEGALEEWGVSAEGNMLYSPTPLESKISFYVIRR